MSESPKNGAAPTDQVSPQYGTNDNFIPLGFSSPINHQAKDECSFYPSQQRNYEVFLSANRRQNYRSHQKNRYYPSNRKSWDCRAMPQQHQHQHQPYNSQQQQKNNNRKFYQDQTPYKQDKDNTESYYHPSMLEDPWKNLLTNFEKKHKDKAECSLQNSQNYAEGKSPSQASGSSKDE